VEITLAAMQKSREGKRQKEIAKRKGMDQRRRIGKKKGRRRYSRVDKKLERLDVGQTGQRKGLEGGEAVDR